MKIYDISQEVFSCRVYPGDPVPQKQRLSKMEEGELYNLTAFSMCAHNGTHVDAPSHFIADGTGVDQIPLAKTVGEAYVCAFDGEIGAEDAQMILQKAKTTKRILIKGTGVVSEEAAKSFASAGIWLIGSESQSIGDEMAPMAVHKVLLKAGIVLLEGIRLDSVPEGRFLLCAQPLNLQGADGSPCRALLLDIEKGDLTW